MKGHILPQYLPLTLSSTDILFLWPFLPLTFSAWVLVFWWVWGLEPGVWSLGFGVLRVGPKPWAEGLRKHVYPISLVGPDPRFKVLRRRLLAAPYQISLAGPRPLEGKGNWNPGLGSGVLSFVLVFWVWDVVLDVWSLGFGVWSWDRTAPRHKI
jgi:hypothetical protein